MKVKGESEKVGLKLNIQKTKIMASSPIISWQIDGKAMETVTDFIFLGSKITADGDCSHDIKRCFFLGRKVMTNLESMLKSRDITSPTIALPCFIVYSKAKLACYSGYLLTSYFCFPIKKISFLVLILEGVVGLHRM